MPAAPSSPPVAHLVDHLFRREFGRLVAILTRHFGIAHLHLAEDVVQDALLQAMRSWPLSGVPLNPTAWLLQTARNQALDQTRRDSLWRNKQPELVVFVEDCLSSALSVPPPQFEAEIQDSQLRMMFVCCHPGLPADVQVALTLKTLCGFGDREIAAAFLLSEAAVTKRLVRARQYLREHAVAVELPKVETLEPRTEMVLRALYQLFNEGYKASQGDSLLRADLCAESIRLAELLVQHPLGDRPSTYALLALMHLSVARFSARTGDGGSLLLLAEQDRTLWNQQQIQRGVCYLAASGSGTELTRYHLEAGIAACHCLAPDFAATDWQRIVTLYDLLLEQEGSAVVALNRAVAVAQVNGPHAGLAALESIQERQTLENYALFHAITGQLWLDAGDTKRAAVGFRRALELVALPAERELLEKRLAQCG